MNPTSLFPYDPSSFEALRESMEVRDGIYWARFGDFWLTSHFQPIVSLTHGRVIGHEGLMRAFDTNDQPVSPIEMLERVKDDWSHLITLDRLARMLHMANSQQVTDGWLFLNMHPAVFAAARSAGRDTFRLSAATEFGLKVNHVVFEVLEHAVDDEVRFADAVRYIHSDGYLVALDDFGAGSSNFERVWQICPEVVKLDRSFAVRIETDPLARRLLPRIVALLHEAGAFVVLEGIETKTQAMIALDANIDFGQGYYFGKPQTEPLKIHSVIDSATKLWQNYDSEIVEQERLTQARLVPYQTAIEHAAEKVSAGASLAEAFADFVALPNVEFCYLLDHDGRQVEGNFYPPGFAVDLIGPRFGPISNIPGARWSRRPYFRRAIENIGKVHSTRPYLSASSARVCITVSLAFMWKGEYHVACGDLIWE